MFFKSKKQASEAQALRDAQSIDIKTHAWVEQPMSGFGGHGVFDNAHNGRMARSIDTVDLIKNTFDDVANKGRVQCSATLKARLEESVETHLDRAQAQPAGMRK